LLHPGHHRRYQRSDLGEDFSNGQGHRLIGFVDGFEQLPDGVAVELGMRRRLLRDASELL
jgi:hypothetical protein